MTKLLPNQFYCLPCKSARAISLDKTRPYETFNTRTKQHVYMMRSTCPICDRSVSKFVNYEYFQNVLANKKKRIC